MRDSLFVELTAQSAPPVSRGRGLKRWTNGSRFCEKHSRRTMTGWTTFWPQWNDKRKGKLDEQTDTEDRRRYTCGCDTALRSTTRSRVPRAHRSDANQEGVAWPGRLEDPGLLHGAGVGRKV